jgi:hypothetical protein
MYSMHNANRVEGLIVKTSLEGQEYQRELSKQRQLRGKLLSIRILVGAIAKGQDQGKVFFFYVPLVPRLQLIPMF